MFETDPTEFAIRGERGIDIFLHLDDPGQKRARFRCIATVTGSGDDAQVVEFEPQAGRGIDTLRRAAQRLGSTPSLNHGFALGDARDWPLAATAPNPVEMFLYLEFFRAWQVADMAMRRLQTRIERDPRAVLGDPTRLSGAISPVFDFNRLTIGLALARRLAPAVQAHAQTPGFRDDRAGNTGYAMRMLGDLCLRAGDPALALTCFDAAIAAGDNPHRRRKALDAALLAHDGAAIRLHADAYRARWPLPADLARRLPPEAT